jgi:hypothetical protein
MFDDESYPFDRSPERRDGIVPRGGRGTPTIMRMKNFS